MDADVLICGLGPVGQLLALLLGGFGVEAIAVDEADEPYPLPRAAVVDDEVLRIFQAAGVDTQILADSQIQREVSYVTSRGRAVEAFRTEHGELGHPPLVSIHQPSMEHTMLAALHERGEAELRRGHRVVRVDQDRDHVTARMRPRDGGPETSVTARYLVGCDGGRSAIREQLGIPFGGSTFAQRWLVVDTLVDRTIAKAPHPHFIGDPARPIVSLPMSPGRHRWEWMLHPGEDERPFLEPDRIRGLLDRWVTDERIEVERAVIYTFHARTAARWRAGRVLLAGDAAHVMPPFVGQGFSSGARDAGNLAWKLDAVLNGAPEPLLDTYEAERRPHVTGMQTMAVRWGGVVQTTNPRVARARDSILGVLDRTGALRAITDRAKPLPTYREGAFARKPHPIAPRRAVGSLFPQPAGLDERLGRGWAAVTASPAATGAWRAVGINAVERPGDRWLSRHRAEWALLRPDRFVFACGGEREMAQAIHALRSATGEGLRSELPPDRAFAATHTDQKGI
jgi:3-(3-hydroxy-phenyl)propionate hydroxylase